MLRVPLLARPAVCDLGGGGWGLTYARPQKNAPPKPTDPPSVCGMSPSPRYSGERVPKGRVRGIPPHRGERSESEAVCRVPFGLASVCFVCHCWLAQQCDLGDGWLGLNVSEPPEKCPLQADGSSIGSQRLPPCTHHKPM